MNEQKITFDKVMRWTAVGGITVAVFAITNYLSSVLLPFFIAWFLAYLLYPMVKFIQYRMHVKVRALATIIAPAPTHTQTLFFAIPSRTCSASSRQRAFAPLGGRGSHTPDLS